MFLNEKVGKEIVDNHFRKLSIDILEKGYKLKSKKFTVRIETDYLAGLRDKLALQKDFKTNSKKVFILVILDGEHPTTWITKQEDFGTFLNKTLPHYTNTNYNFYNLNEVLDIFTRFDNLPEKEALKVIRKNIR